MIRTAIYAWSTGFGLVFATALVAGPGPSAVAAKSRLELASGSLTGGAGEIARPVAAPGMLQSSPSVLSSQPSDATPLTSMPIAAEPTPVAPVAGLPVAGSPTAATPVAVQFVGVPPSQIVGDRVNLDLSVAGSVASYAWTVMPPGTAGLKIYDGGAKADFTNRHPGTYVFLVAVAGADGSVAQAYHALELRTDVPATPPAAPEPAATTAAQPHSAASHVAAAPQAQPAALSDDPVALLKQWTAEVKTRNRRGEQLQLASGFRQAAGAIDSGLFVGGDLFGQTKALCTLSLGGALGPWQEWFDKVEQLYREFDRLHVLGTPANFSAANKSVAQVLETFGD